jgi:hypothetical protein
MKRFKMRMLILVVLLTGLWFSQVIGAEPVDNKSIANLSVEGYGAGGYDPVSYFSGKPELGKSEIAFIHKGIPYRFSRLDNLERFMVDPERYVPAFGGWCAWAMLEGKKVKIDPERFKIVDGVNYLFYDGFWGNTLKKWNNRSEKETEETLVRLADKQWQKISSE